MPSSTSPTAGLQCNKIGHLDTFTIHGQGFRAVVLKQGAQLIHFLTEDVDTVNAVSVLSADNDNRGINSLQDDDLSHHNWLWLSETAEYNLGESVRGGVPICWPVFGQFDANPQSVKDSFTTINDMPQHGYVRTQLFELDNFESENCQSDRQITEDSDTDSRTNSEADSQTATLVLRLDKQNLDNRFAQSPDLDLKVVFTFNAHGFGIKLITQNNSDSTVTFSQALHTYLPTPDITQTYIKGFDKVTYSDALTVDANTGGWQTKTQHGDITFEGEVDRVYHDAPDIMLQTPQHRYHLVATDSQSTVIWNPWVEKSKHISQFGAGDYQRMLCIETANAHLDVVDLGAGEVHTLSVNIKRDKNHET